MHIDLPGTAILDFWERHQSAKLFVHDQFGPKVEMPIALYFRSEEQMPPLEKKALEACWGNVLEIGAGAGSHALTLQKRSLDITALEISPYSCRVMKERGVKKIICEDVFLYQPEIPFQTLLLLMNGIGLCGTIKGLKRFLKKAAAFLAPGGQMLFDSSDIRYMYEEIPFPENYYGEVSCFYEYQGKTSAPLKWLYIDPQKLSEIALTLDWQTEILFEEEEQYLFRLTKLKT